MGNTCHMGSHSVTCHTAVAKIPPLPQPKQVLDLTVLEGCKAELTCYVKADRPGIEPATYKSQVEHLTGKPPRNIRSISGEIKALKPQTGGLKG